MTSAVVITSAELIKFILETFKSYRDIINVLFVEVLVGAFCNWQRMSLE